MLRNHVNALCQRTVTSRIVYSYLCLDAMAKGLWTCIDGNYSTRTIIIL
jgi:hypothetical protein